MENQREPMTASSAAEAGSLNVEALKIVLLVGTIYSGSTITNIALGNHPDIVSCGEIDISPHLFLAKRFRCSCGVYDGKCPYWNRIRVRWEAAAGARLEEFVAYQLRYERFSRFPLALWNFLFPSRDYKRYLDFHARFYEAIAAESGRRVLVDASKNPIRAFNLSRRFRRQVALIHLVKDGRAFLWSMKKRKDDAQRVNTVFKKTVFYDVLVWLFVNGFSSLLFWLYPRGQKARIRQERLLPDLKAGLATLGGFLDLEFSAFTDQLEQGLTLAPQHSMNGNAIRMRSNLSLSTEADETWKSKLTIFDRLIFFATGGSLMNRIWHPR